MACSDARHLWFFSGSTLGQAQRSAGDNLRQPRILAQVTVEQPATSLVQEL
jgi:hypothetical protein